MFLWIQIQRALKPAPSLPKRVRLVQGAMLELRLVTLAFDPSAGGFPAEPLADLEGEIVSVVEHFFSHEGRPHLLLVVHHRPRATERKARGRPVGAPGGPPDLRATLSGSERLLYDRLRAWRNGRAEADGVPPYIILSNRQVTEVARRRPDTLASLQAVKGIGKAKAQRYGEALLAVVAAPEGAPPEASEGGDA